MTTIRLATTADWPVLARFNQAMALETERRHLPNGIVQAGVQGLFDRPELGFYLLAEVDQQPAGSLMITFEWSDWRNRVFWWIQSVYVLPEYRGRGLYRQLYQEVKRRAAADGQVCGLRLYVERENTRAQAVYEHLGMQQAPYLMYEEPL